MFCDKCGARIPAERLQALPDTRVCAKCSDTQPKQAVDSWHGRTPVEHKAQHARAGRAYSTDWWNR